VGIFASVANRVTDNLVGNFGGAGILLRSGYGKAPPGFPRVPEDQTIHVTGNQVINCGIGIQAAQTRGGVIANNRISDCTKAGIVIADIPVDARSLPGFSGDPNSNPWKTPTIDVQVSKNTFTNISGPGIAIASSAVDVFEGRYTPNTRTLPEASGPNFYQPSPVLVEAKKQADGSIIVTGTAPASGTLELYSSSRAARPAAPPTDWMAYGLGTFILDTQVPMGSFTVTIPASQTTGVTSLTATLSAVRPPDVAQGEMKSGIQTSEFARTIDIKTEPAPPDTEKPTVTVLAPTAGIVVESSDNATVGVMWRSSDNVGVTGQAVKFTGKRNGQAFEQLVATGLPAAATGFQLNIAKNDAVTDAQVIVEATDAAGNAGQGRSGGFTVVAPVPPDTEKPIVSAVTLSRTKVKRKKDPTLVISWTSSDNAGVVAHDISYATDGVNFSTAVISGLPGNAQSFTWEVSASLPKTRIGVVRVIARDAAGNVGDAVSRAFALK
jgi:hypothetical protein